MEKLSPYLHLSFQLAAGRSTTVIASPVAPAAIARRVRQRRR